MTTLTELRDTLKLCEAWHGHRPVRVLVAGRIMEIDEIHDIGFNGGAEGVILLCKNESSQKVPLAPSLLDSGSKILDAVFPPEQPSLENMVDPQD